MNKIKNLYYNVRDRQRISIGIAKGIASSNSRNLKNDDPISWEFSGFSQNGEDGIIQHLLSKLLKKNKFFIEIGSADGIDNNSAWLTIVNKYNGIMVEGDKALSDRSRLIVQPYSLGLEIINEMVNVTNIRKIVEKSPTSDPDVVCVDIDSIDYYIVDQIIKLGLRPKIFVLEYNSVYGKEKSMTVPYTENFSFAKMHSSALYYGVSLECWKQYFSRIGYYFVTVESNGVNSFFIDPIHFDKDFVSNIKGLKFAENRFQSMKFKTNHESQFDLIKNMPFNFLE